MNFSILTHRNSSGFVFHSQMWLYTEPSLISPSHESIPHPNHHTHSCILAYIMFGVLLTPLIVALGQPFHRNCQGVPDKTHYQNSSFSFVPFLTPLLHSTPKITGPHTSKCSNEPSGILNTQFKLKTDVSQYHHPPCFSREHGCSYLFLHICLVLNQDTFLVSLVHIPIPISTKWFQNLILVLNSRRIHHLIYFSWCYSCTSNHYGLLRSLPTSFHSCLVALSLIGFLQDPFFLTRLTFRHSWACFG